MPNQWSFSETAFKELYKIQPFCMPDNRGFFLKDYSDEIFKQNGIDYNLKEVFYSFSHKNVIRGMHFQHEKQMPKLVRCIQGEILDIVCDLRENSETFGKWQSFILSEENMTELLIPGGMAHGFLARKDSLVAYKCAENFCKDYDDGIVWNDPDLNIDWQISDDVCPIISEKDMQLQSFKEFSDKYKALRYK